MLRARRYAIGLSGLLAVLLLVWLSQRSTAWPAYTLLRAPLAESVVASGRVIPPATVALASQITGTVSAVKVREGEACQAGQLLLQLSDAELRAQLEQAQAQVIQAQAKREQLDDLSLPQAQQGVAQARTSLALARRTLERNRALAQTGFVSPAAVDEAQQQVDLAASRLASAEAGLASNRAGSERRLAAANLQNARAVVALAQARLDQLSLRAPADCTVLSREVEPGQVAQTGKTLLTLALAGPTRISMLLDEKRLGHLAIGQAATVLADAYPDQPFAARVAEIAPQVDRATGTVEIKLAVPQPPAFLRADMTVSAEVKVASRTAALVLPGDAVFERDGQRRVWRVESGRAVERPVRLGLAGIGQVEIVAGLDEGDVVLAPGSKPLSAGLRVRPQLEAP